MASFNGVVQMLAQIIGPVVFTSGCIVLLVIAWLRVTPKGQRWDELKMTFRAMFGRY